MSNVTLIRRANMQSLFQAFVERAIASGAPPKGLEQAFAASLEISPSLWSQIKSARPIGDKLARQIEVHAGRPAGWLDDERQDAQPTETERRFLELALKAFRAAGGNDRKALRDTLRALASSAH